MPVFLTKADLAEFVTKADLAAALANFATKNDLAVLEAHLKADMSALEARLFKWTAGAIGFQTIAIIGGLFAIIRGFGH
jgi:hypothetical protein